MADLTGVAVQDIMITNAVYKHLKNNMRNILKIIFISFLTVSIDGRLKRQKTWL